MIGTLHLMPFQFDVRQLNTELGWYPELWDSFDLRTNHPASPHREMSDILVRYNARQNFTGDRDAFNGPHDAVWWDAIEKLPAVAPLVFELMHRVQGERLGMVLITRQPAGATCYPHVDRGWHAKHYDKFAIQLASAPGQAFHVQAPGCKPQSLQTKAGDCFMFNNSFPHWVTNESTEARMTMIVCIRTRFTKTSEALCQSVGQQ